MKKLILVLVLFFSLVTCTNKDRQNAAAQRVKQATLDSINYAKAQQRKIDSLEALTKTSATATALEREGPAMTPLGESRKHPARRVHGVNPAPTVHAPANAPTNQTAGSAAGNSTVAASGNAPATATTATEKKKGLNNAAKGALIGLGTGAAAGAIIGKDNRGKGAVIGGVLGAIGGAVGGAVIDKHKAKKAAKDTVK